MTDDQNENVLADCLEELHVRRARGEPADPAEFRDRLGAAYAEFQELLLTESCIDEALEPPATQPLPAAWGPYMLLSELGRGASGIVYEAVHRTLGRKVALKVLRTGIDTDDLARERFTREAQALAQVHHPNIVEIYEFGDVDGRPYYSMELVTGSSLAQLVKQDARPEPKQLCAGLVGIAKALHTLHEAGIVHRDVKPSNIMIKSDGRYVLADFGLARTAMATTVTRTGDALGTPLYMSPEQMLGDREAVDRRTDVYGLGASLYQLLTGQPPFKTDNMHALMRMVLSERPEAARAVDPTVPAGCSAIAMKCLEKEPKDRYQSAAELEQDLAAFSAGERVAGRPLTRVQRSSRWVRSRPYVAAAAVLLVAFGAYMFLRPAAFTLRTWPPTVQAEVQIDGGGWRPLPLLDESLAPYTDHNVVLRAKVDGFEPVTLSVKGSPGAELRYYEAFPYSDPDHPEVRRALFELAQVKRVGGINAPSGHRGADDDPLLEVCYPRGTVRLEDLIEWRLAVNLDFPEKYGQDGFVEFRVVGQDEPIHRERFPEPEHIVTTKALPEAARKKLRPGDDVVWGYVPPGKKDFVKAVRFTVVAVDLSSDFARIDTQLRPLDEEGRPVMRASLRAATYLNHGLALAAWKEVEGAIADGAKSLYLLHLQRTAIEKMYANESEDMADESTLWQDWRARWDAVPLADRERFVASAGADD